MKLMNFMKYEIPFKTIHTYFQLNEHTFFNSSSSSILLLTYNLQIPFPILFSLNALGWRAGTKSISFTTNLFCPLSAQFLSWLRNHYFLGLMNITPSTFIWCSLRLHLFSWHVIQQLLQTGQQLLCFPLGLFYLLPIFTFLLLFAFLLLVLSQFLNSSPLSIP